MRRLVSFRGSALGTAVVAAVLVIGMLMVAAASAAANGTVMAWGANDVGQLGDGSTTNSDVPVAVSGLSGVTAVSAGGEYSVELGEFSLALLGNGTIMAWGANEHGQLGDGITTSSDVPVPVSLSPPPGVTVTAVSAGSGFSLALLNNGTVMAWGYNPFGELGNGTTTSSDVPVPVSLSPPAGVTVTAVSAGYDHSLALLSNGTVMAWGENSLGELGSATKADSGCYCSDVPVVVSGLNGVTAISAGGRHSMALLSNHTVLAWGANYYGELGDGTVTGPETCDGAAYCSDVPVAVSGLGGVTEVSAGWDNSLALLSSGEVMAWGGNYAGELGDGAETSSDVPVTVSLSPPSGIAVTSVAGGFGNGLALLSNGTVMAWGSNPFGELGDGTTTGPETCQGADPCSKIPVAVSGAISGDLNGVTAVSAGEAHSLALVSNGGTPPPAQQTIMFTSTPPSPATVGGSYAVSATGGGSGNPVTFSIDLSSTAGACSVLDATVSFTGAGGCVIDANQTASSGYQSAPEVQQTIPITNPPQTVTPSAPTITGVTTSPSSPPSSSIAAPPSNTAPPILSGSPRPGYTLTCSPGTWTNNPTGFSYQWTRDGKPMATGPTYVVHITDESQALTCTVTASNAGGSASASASVAAPPGARATGYWLVASNGAVFAFGGAKYYGSIGGVHLSKPIVGMAVTPDGKGYWMVSSDGAVFALGDTHFYGSTGGVKLSARIVGMAATPDGKGYWLVASDGAVFAFGDAHYYGSTAGVHLTKPIVGMAVTPDGKGYWLVASDGAVFAFGDAHYYGSTAGVKLSRPIVGMAASPDGQGYWLVARDGAVFTFGDAHFYGSTAGIHLAKPIVGMAVTPDGKGYWMVARDGDIFAFGDAHFYGSTGGVHLSKPIVGMAVTSPSILTLSAGG